jgi:dephospho-CoA kinase
MLVIGVTGNFGTGKTTVCEILAELGAAVINADNLGHELLRRDTLICQELVAAFGQVILAPDKEIDHKKLAQAAFKDRASQARLNSITHPAIYRLVQQEIEQCRQNGAKIVVLEAALLIEAGWKSLADIIWVTVAPQAVIVSRLGSQRGFKQKQVLARLHTQMASEEKIKYADEVIDTDCSREQLMDKVVNLWQKLPSSPNK